MRQDNYKRVSIRAKSAQIADFRIAGVTNLSQENHTIRFFYKGSARALIAAISKCEFDDVIIEDPSLEEIFMHYYGQVTT